MTADACDHRAAPVDATRTTVRAALNRLPPLHRALICMACHRGWTMDRIAADLGVTEAVARAQLHCALHALRRLLADPPSRA